MAFSLFHDLCPEIAERETRSITLAPTERSLLPTTEYVFLEMFCDERGCDCRRVMFSVLSKETKRFEAVIAWGWEELAFYQRWLRDSDPDMAKEMQGPVLNMMSPQSKFAPALLDLVGNVLLTDPEYVERIKRHYALFRSKVDGKRGNLAKDWRRKGRKK